MYCICKNIDQILKTLKIKENKKTVSPRYVIVGLSFVDIVFSFYLSEITLGLEHLHKMGIIYRYTLQIKLIFILMSRL